MGSESEMTIAERNASHALICKASDSGLERRVARQIVELIVFLKKYHVQPVFYSPPYTDIYLNALEDRLKGICAHTAELMNTISAEHDVAYHNFMQDRSFSHRYDLFQNMSHLNSVGAKYFSEQLRIRLNLFYSANTKKRATGSTPL